jgi:hypothetical protein
VQGLALAGLVLAIFHSTRRPRVYPISAGHWLLTVGGVLVVATEVTDAISLSMADPLRRGATVFSCFLLAMLNFGIAVSVRERLSWRIIFFGNATHYLLLAFTFLMGMIFENSFLIGLFFWPNYAIGWLLRVAIVTISIIEICRGQTRDWLHWVGIAYCVLEAGLTLLNQVLLL